MHADEINVAATEELGKEVYHCCLLYTSEQYVFYNTHEPIISQELWDSVQKRKKRANRTATKGTHSNRLSGYLYCADCGRRMTLQTHYSKKDRSVQYSYRCGGYASRVNACTAHSISADNVEALILSAVKRLRCV